MLSLCAAQPMSSPRTGVLRLLTCSAITTWVRPTVVTHKPSCLSECAWTIANGSGPRRTSPTSCAPGANFRALGFQMSLAIAVGGVRAIVLIGHNQCGMASLRARRSEFIGGLIEGAGWSRDQAESHFDALSPEFEISDAVELVRSQAQHLRQQYPRVVVAPLMYDVEDGMLYQLDEPEESRR